MCVQCGHVCNTWFDLRRIGLQGEGCIRNTAFLSNIQVPCTQNVINPRIYVQQPSRRLTALKTMPGATYSRIEIGQDISNQHVFIKSPLIPGKSLLYEACIQQMVKDSLDRGHFVRAAAAVHDVFKLSDGSICFSMDIFEEAVPLSVLIQRLQNTDLTSLVLELLLQLSAMLYHLATDLGMNHRDLKPSNIMVEMRKQSKPLVLKVDAHRITIHSQMSISLVDFGFSCIGRTGSQVSDLAIGDVYSSADPCPKDGRDLYMFLAFLYMDCGKRIGEDLRILFGKWLQNDVTGILRKIDRYGHEFDPWIYFITGNERIRKFECCPERIFQDLSR